MTFCLQTSAKALMSYVKMYFPVILVLIASDCLCINELNFNYTLMFRLDIQFDGQIVKVEFCSSVPRLPASDRR